MVLECETPFRPFTVVTVSGSGHEIDHSEAILERDGVTLFAAPGAFRFSPEIKITRALSAR